MNQSSLNETKRTRSKVAAAAMLAMVATTAGCGVAKNDAPATSATPATSNETSQNNAPVQGASYKDGTYTALGSYTSPAGPEEVGVTLTFKNNVITAAQVEKKATNPGSVRFQGIFADNYSSLVVGKKVDEVQLDKVSGSSLTPKGFNDALAKIKVEATRS